MVTTIPLATTMSGRVTALGLALLLLCSVASAFTGKERDAETGLDYFGARYMSAAQGRFTSPDLPANYLVRSEERRVGKECA